jgi:uncharacterized protein with von Willebrand factor type A (vWA) domain
MSTGWPPRSFDWMMIRRPRRDERFDRAFDELFPRAQVLAYRIIIQSNDRGGQPVDIHSASPVPRPRTWRNAERFWAENGQGVGARRVKRRPPLDHRLTRRGLRTTS